MTYPLVLCIPHYPRQPWYFLQFGCSQVLQERRKAQWVSQRCELGPTHQEEYRGEYAMDIHSFVFSVFPWMWHLRTRCDIDNARYLGIHFGFICHTLRPITLVIEPQFSYLMETSHAFLHQLQVSSFVGESIRT